MALELNAIERSCLRTSGGIKQIVLIDPDDLNTQPDWYVAPSIADLDFASGKAAYAFQHQRFTATLTDETPIDAQAGDYFTYRLTAFIRVIRAEVELLRAKLLNRRTHVIATYMDGSQRFLPNMRLTGKGDSGARYGKDSPGVQFTGALRLNRPAPFVAADIGAFVATSALLTIDRAITGTGTSGTPLTIPLGWMKPANSITCTVVGAFTPTSMTTGLALFWIPVGSVAGVGQLSAYINTSAASLTAHVDYRASTVLSLAHDPTFPADLPGQPWTP